MNDLHNTLLDIARTAVEHDATLLNEIPCRIDDGPRHPEEDADYLSDDEVKKEIEKQRQEWWFQEDEDDEWIRSFYEDDFAEYQGEDR